MTQVLRREERGAVGHNDENKDEVEELIMSQENPETGKW